MLLCSFAGKFSSEPARSKPTTPRFLYLTARSANFNDASGEICLMPQTIIPDFTPKSFSPLLNPCAQTQELLPKPCLS